MDFFNSTKFPASFLAGSMGEAEMLGIVVTKITYFLDQGALIPVPPEESWPIFEKPFVFRGVNFSPELDYRKQGIDIIVFGKAMARNRVPVKKVSVAVECGDVNYQIDVFGDRIWQKSKGELVPSEPEQFLEMDLSNNRAFGGMAIWEDSKVAHSVNPDGCGFYLSKDTAAGQPLPNLERPDSLIQKWTDQPRPACLFKPKGIYFDGNETDKPEDLVVPLIDSFFNQTVPELVLKDDHVGENIRLSGLSATGDIIFPTPPSTGPISFVTVGSLKSRFPSKLSSLVLLADEKVLIASYLCLFRYLFRPMEKRHIKLEWLDRPMNGLSNAQGDRCG